MRIRSFVLAAILLATTNVTAASSPGQDAELWHALETIHLRETFAREAHRHFVVMMTGVGGAMLSHIGTLVGPKPRRQKFVAAAMGSGLVSAFAAFLAADDARNLAEVSPNDAWYSVFTKDRKVILIEDEAFRYLTDLFKLPLMEQYQVAGENPALRDYIVALDRWYAAGVDRGVPPIKAGEGASSSVGASVRSGEQ